MLRCKRTERPDVHGRWSGNEGGARGIELRTNFELRVVPGDVCTFGQKMIKTFYTTWIDRFLESTWYTYPATQDEYSTSTFCLFTMRYIRQRDRSLLSYLKREQERTTRVLSSIWPSFIYCRINFPNNSSALDRPRQYRIPVTFSLLRPAAAPSLTRPTHPPTNRPHASLTTSRRDRVPLLMHYRGFAPRRAAVTNCPGDWPARY